MNIETESNIYEIILSFNKDLRLKKSVLTELSEIMRSDIEENLLNGRSFDGSSIKPKLTGGRIFYKTGDLFNSVKKRISNDIGEIFISSNRSKIAEYLNFGTKKMVSRPFFGISDRINSNISDYLNSKTYQEIFET